MSKLMKVVPMSELMARISGEWAAKKTIFDIPEELVLRTLELERRSPGFTVNGLKIGLPVGPAAGPHTQIAQNLVAAWLSGSRVFELKTVQENDRLEIAKPCIDALDEGHNTEWSTELLLEEASAEYLRGWVAIHVLRAALSGSGGELMFNMSVGYTLDGIKGKKVNEFIETMRYPEASAAWKAAVDEASAVVGSTEFTKAFGQAGTGRARAVLRDMPNRSVHSVTLSTMHGCPPSEIERIGTYLIEEKGFDTYIKLNPTLLGYDAVRAILDETGWERIEISRDGFEHDLQFESALSLIASLRAKAAKKGVRFGIKLSNTLANANGGDRLPGSERYMSGRALFPITIRLAEKLASALPEPLPFSYCGGVSARNAGECFACGLGPLTVATDVLKPGGYLRFEGIAESAVRALERSIPLFPDPAKLASLAAAALKDNAYRGDYKKGETVIKRKLPLFDCFSAPCKEACPAGQRPPAYMKALAKGDSEKALAIVYEDNPLPRITGILCDHQCMYACARVDYEGPVQIRGMKLACARTCSIPALPAAPVSGKGKSAVFGSGPAGLSCAHYLALQGYPVSVFETAASAGGIPAGIIPEFRISREDLGADIDRIASMGVEFHVGQDRAIDTERLKAEGYTSIVIATGAPVPRQLPLAGEGIKTVDALEFLDVARKSPSVYGFAKTVVVAGGGNTAMDAARVASRLPGKPAVTILYRRTLAEMPADREEFEAALADGIAYRELSLPESIALPPNEGKALLAVREMDLGEPDTSGRRAPVVSDRTYSLECELLIAAIGEMPDREQLCGLGVELGKDGRPVVDELSMRTRVNNLYVIGDARRGPSTIIAGIADGRKAALSILSSAGVEVGESETSSPKPDRGELSGRGAYLPSIEDADGTVNKSQEWIQREAKRCLSCGSACLRCVEVCPNRANFALPVATEKASAFSQSIQILHLDESCNECGNCGFFCPYEGDPCKGKPSLFKSETELKDSGNPGFAFLGDSSMPDLLVRGSGGKNSNVNLISWKAWHNSPAYQLEPMIGIAREVFANNKYLIPGGDK